MTKQYIITEAQIDLVADQCSVVEGENRVDLNLLLQSLPEMTAEPVVNWRCYHCNEVFTSRESASEHFGRNEYSYPICKINAKQYREMERQSAQVKRTRQ